MHADLSSSDFGPPKFTESLLAGPLVELEADLTARAKVPAETLDEYIEWPERDLRSETMSVRRILRRFAEIVVESFENPASVDSFLASLDLKAISRDHDWRSIFAAIRDCVSCSNDKRRAVFLKYLQYLSFRKRLLEYIYLRRAGLAETGTLSLQAETLRGYAEAPSDSPDITVRTVHGESCERLPMGEPVAIRLAKGATVRIMLGKHLFRLVGVSPVSLIDQNGVMRFLQQGRNLVGRHPESDVVVDSRLRDVSRAHMVMEWDGADTIHIIDLSSKGTFLFK